MYYLNPKTEKDGAKLNTPKKPNTPKKLNTENGTKPNTPNVGTKPNTPKKLNTENGTNEKVVTLPEGAEAADLPLALSA